MALSEDTMSKCSEHLSAYKSACEKHPKLKLFDSSLQQQTNKVIDSLTSGAETGLSAQHAAHMEVAKHIDGVSEGVKDFIVDSEDDVWKNKAIRSLVQAFFESTSKTLDILTNVEKCVNKAVNGELIIKQAVAQFDKESAENDVGGKKKYEKTLKKLKEFKAMGDPFDGRELRTQFEFVTEQQKSLLDKVVELKKKLDKEIENLHTGRIISHVVFGAVFLFAVVATIALLVSGVGTVMGVTLAESLPFIAMGWVGVYTTLERRIDALERQTQALKELENKLDSEEKGTETNINTMVSVYKQVDRLETKIESLTDTVDNALRSEEEETDTRLALDVIRERVIKLTKGIKEVGDAVDRAWKRIETAREQVMNKMNGSA